MICRGLVVLDDDDGKAVVLELLDVVGAGVVVVLVIGRYTITGGLSIVACGRFRSRSS